MRYHDAIQALIDTANRQGHALTLYSHKLDLDVVYTLVDLTEDREVFSTCFLPLAFTRLLHYISSGYRHDEEVNDA
jgi:hypothetical protein|uniref:Uncharacterized protein n=1 Tax=Podoviridae sp. ctdxt3 TaxID=2825263 RepID=A0A8S5U8A4_9CAUD|nr:MAG TPA: hypothetical protein [Podoviridae sp. ctdxt3]